MPLLKSIVNLRNPQTSLSLSCSAHNDVAGLIIWFYTRSNYSNLSLSLCFFKKSSYIPHTTTTLIICPLTFVHQRTVKRKLWLNRQRPRWRCKVGLDGKPHPRCFPRIFYGERWFLGRTSCRPGSTVWWNNHENLEKKIFRQVNSYICQKSCSCRSKKHFMWILTDCTSFRKVLSFYKFMEKI